MSSPVEVRKVSLWDGYFMRPLDEEGIALSGDDLKTYEKIESIVKEFCHKLDLTESTVVLSTSPGWSNFHDHFFIPAKCFSEETRNQIDQVWAEKSRYPIPDEYKKTLAKIATVEREIFTSMSVDEWRMVIGHELGHAWLNHHFKAFYSQSIQIEEKPVANSKHDRAQEKVCDFIGVYLTSPQVGMEALRKECANSQVNDSGDATHPPLKERIQYISEWVDDPRLKEKLTEELVLKMGGADFQEAVPIYVKYGK